MAPTLTLLSASTSLRATSFAVSTSTRGIRAIARGQGLTWHKGAVFVNYVYDFNHAAALMSEALQGRVLVTRDENFGIHETPSFFARKWRPASPMKHGDAPPKTVVDTVLSQAKPPSPVLESASRLSIELSSTPYLPSVCPCLVAGRAQTTRAESLESTRSYVDWPGWAAEVATLDRLLNQWAGKVQFETTTIFTSNVRTVLELQSGVNEQARTRNVRRKLRQLRGAVRVQLVEPTELKAWSELMVKARLV